jgi:hypothetical protein
MRNDEAMLEHSLRNIHSYLAFACVFVARGPAAASQAFGHVAADS